MMYLWSVRVNITAGTADAAVRHAFGQPGSQAKACHCTTSYDNEYIPCAGDVKLAMPEVDLSDPSTAAKDPELVTQLESSLHEWSTAIGDLLQRELAKKVDEPGELVAQAASPSCP